MNTKNRPYMTREMGGLSVRVWMPDLDENGPDTGEELVSDAATAVLLAMGIDPDSDGKRVTVEVDGRECVVDLNPWHIDDESEWEING